MSKKSEEELYEKLKGNKASLNTKDFILLKADEQYKLAEETLNKMYENNVKISKRNINKIIDSVYDNNNVDIFLPHNLHIQKIDNKLVFSFKKHRNPMIFVSFTLGIALLIGFATYLGVLAFHSKDLNIDINGDGIADLNIDLNGDGICDINCDIDDDKKPDLNIDYMGNRKALFNIKNIDGTIINPTNQDLDNDGICDLNCDYNEDGWPEVNLDFTNSGKAQVNVDIKKDKLPELNLDTNKDMIPDLNIDKDNDGLCDENCIYVATKDGQLNVGEGLITEGTAALIIRYQDTALAESTNIFPDDQEGDVTTKVPDLLMSVENYSNDTLYYDLKWTNIVNTFTSQNFWFKVASTNGGYTQDYKTAPFTNSNIATRIAIPSHTIQEYTISFTLHGTGEEQNYDQGRMFKGRVIVELVP